MKKLSIVFLFAIGGLIPIFAGDETIQIEPGIGYDLGVGAGQSYSFKDEKDTSGTYQGKHMEHFGNYGLVGLLNVNINLGEDVYLKLGSNVTLADIALKEAKSWNPDGSVATEYNHDISWIRFKFKPGIRYTFIKGRVFSVYGGLGAIITPPQDINYAFDDGNTNKVESFDFGFGGYAELGFQIALGQTFAFDVGLSFDAVGAAMNKSVTTYSTGGSTTFTYVDNPKTDTNSQTVEDVANTNGSDYYYTLLKNRVDFSNLGFFVGLIIKI